MCEYSTYLKIFINKTENFREQKKSKEKEEKKTNEGRSRRIQRENIIEESFSWIESCKKVFPIYEIKETSYLGVVMVAVIIRLNEVLG